jgi:hypothetical protein
MLFKFGGIHNCLQTILKETTNKFKMVLFEELKILFSKSERLFFEKSFELQNIENINKKKFPHLKG